VAIKKSILTPFISQMDQDAFNQEVLPEDYSSASSALW
jgi:hypothetical protein